MTQRRSALARYLRLAHAATWALLLLACASPPAAPPTPPESYVVLLSNDDGSTGQLELTNRAGTTRLDQNRQGTNLADSSVASSAGGQTFFVSQRKIDQDFAAALAATPIAPVSFLLYFEVGGAKLSAQSEGVIAQILQAINVRAESDISIIGHTDTAGDDATNERLGLERARFVADLIGASRRIAANKVAVVSHGEKNPLVPTPDNTAEARNRRVEVTVR